MAPFHTIFGYSFRTEGSSIHIAGDLVVKNQAIDAKGFFESIQRGTDFFPAVLVRESETRTKQLFA